MSVYAKAPDQTFHGGGANSTPYFKKPDNTWVPGTTLYYKTPGNVWQEVWPLRPNAPTAVVLGMPYRNDRIELDVSWTAPVGGTAVAYYLTTITINGSTYTLGSLQITAPTVAFTLTNASLNAAGFANYAGLTLTVTVAAVTADGVGATTFASASIVVPQLPPPPAVTSMGATLSFGDITYHWSSTGGNRVSGYQVQVFHSSGPSAFYFFGMWVGVSTSSASPVAGANINGGTYFVRVTAIGPGGSSALVELVVTVPSDPIDFGGPSFTTGVFVATKGLGPGTTSHNVYYNANGGTPTFFINTSSQSIVVNVSAGWARDNVTAWRLIIVPVNANGTGRVKQYGPVRKMANPYIFNPDDSATWNFGQWQADSGGNYVFQGYTPQAGFYWGYAFYGNRIFQAMNPGYVGQQLHCTQLTIWMGREGPTTGPYFANFDGPAAPVQILFALHTAADRNGHTEQMAGTFAATDGSTYYGHDDYHYAVLPTYWGDDLINAVNGWKGVGIFSPDAQVQFLPPNGTSNSMARMLGHLRAATHFFWQLEIFHDG